MATFGGFAPFIATWLVVLTGSQIAPTYHAIGAAVVTGAVIQGLRENARMQLR